MAEFGQERLGGVGVGLGWIGKIGPDCVINDLRSFLQVNVHGGFKHIDAFQ